MKKTHVAQATNNDHSGRPTYALKKVYFHIKPKEALTHVFTVYTKCKSTVGIAGSCYFVEP